MVYNYKYELFLELGHYRKERSCWRRFPRSGCTLCRRKQRPSSTAEDPNPKSGDMGTDNAKKLRFTLCVCLILGVVVGTVNSAGIQMPTDHGDGNTPVLQGHGDGGNLKPIMGKKDEEKGSGADGKKKKPKQSEGKKGSGKDGNKPIISEGEGGKKPVISEGKGGKKPIIGDEGGKAAGGEKPVDGGEKGAGGDEPVEGGEKGAGAEKPVDGGEKGAGGDEPVDGGEKGAGGDEPVDGGEKGAGGDEPAPGGEEGAGGKGVEQPISDRGQTTNPTGPGVFNVMKYGAVADGKANNVKAFMAAWQAACAYKAGQAEMVIPAGTFLLGEIIFSGPCAYKTAPKVTINGNVKAVVSSAAFSEAEWISFRILHGLTITGSGTIDGQGDKEAWATKTQCGKRNKCRFMPTSLKIISCTEVTLSGLLVVNSKGYHVRINKSTNMHISNLKVTAPDDSPNTDGVHISTSTNVTLTKSIIGVGDDCVSLGNGNTNIFVSDIQCGPGHGISVGSLGKYKDEKPVNGIFVKNCKLTGTDNGVRIKTWGASPELTAKNMKFENIIMDRVSFPIIIDQVYCPNAKCADVPSNVAISDITFRNITGTSFTKLAVNLVCSRKYPCKNIIMEDINLTHQNTNQATAAMCLNTKPLTSGTMDPPPCK